MKKKMTMFGIEVKKRLIDKNMTQTELAQKLGVKKQYLNLILTGERQNSRYIAKIREFLDMSA